MRRHRKQRQRWPWQAGSLQRHSLQQRSAPSHKLPRHHTQVTPSGSTHPAGPGRLPPPRAPLAPRSHTCRQAGGGAGCRQRVERRQQHGSAGCISWLPAAARPFRRRKDQPIPIFPSAPHRMARRPEAARPSSTRTPWPAAGGLAPRGPRPELAAFLCVLRAAPLAISRSRCAIKYLSTAGEGAGRARPGGGVAGSWWRCGEARTQPNAQAMPVPQLRQQPHAGVQRLGGARRTRQAHVSVDHLGRVEEGFVARLQDAAPPLGAHREALGHGPGGHGKGWQWSTSEWTAVQAAAAGTRAGGGSNSQPSFGVPSRPPCTLHASECSTHLLGAASTTRASHVAAIERCWEARGIRRCCSGSSSAVSARRTSMVHKPALAVGHVLQSSASNADYLWVCRQRCGQGVAMRHARFFSHALTAAGRRLLRPLARSCEHGAFLLQGSGHCPGHMHIRATILNLHSSNATQGRRRPCCRTPGGAGAPRLNPSLSGPARVPPYPTVLQYRIAAPCRHSRAMQRALLFAQSVRALQQLRGLSPEVCLRILQARGCWHASSWAWTPPPSRRSAAARRRSFAAASLSSSEQLGAAASQITEEAAAQPELPLCERQAQHATPLVDLLAWREAAAAQVAAVGDSWAREQPDGPTAEDLQVCGGGWLQAYCVGPWQAAHCTACRHALGPGLPAHPPLATTLATLAATDGAELAAR